MNPQEENIPIRLSVTLIEKDGVCHGCLSAANFRNVKRYTVTEIYDLRVGNHVTTLCRDCVELLGVECAEALA